MSAHEHERSGLESQLRLAEPDDGGLDAEQMLERVLGNVLEEPVEPLKAGRYVILEPIGQGGLGAVHAAYDPELDRKVAIKLLRSDAAGSGLGELKARLLREAQAMAKLTHPNVVAIHDVGTFRDELFIAMELVDGVTLGAWMRQKPRPWQEIRDVFVLAGRGLAAVHDAGMVQRDFKPANVVVAHDGGVKVLDFGLARAVAEIADAQAALPPAATSTSSASLLAQHLTHAGYVVGTPAYMAPEQCQPGPVDARADQFAFCVTLYEALSGERPFVGRTLDERVAAIRAQTFAAPSRGSKLPPWLRRAMLQGLAFHPAERHASMHALLEQLQRDRHRRRRSWLAAGAVAPASALATAAFFLLYEPDATPEQLAEVERLASAARHAAEDQHFIYPPLDAPTEPTAYSSTLALEHIEGPASSVARAEAAALRSELSGTLGELGDRYSAEPGGAGFAADYYAAAVLFDPGNEHARARSYLTEAQLGALAARAEQLDFDEVELVAGESLAALAEPDAATRRRKVSGLRAGARPVRATTLAQLEALVPEANGSGSVGDPPSSPRTAEPPREGTRPSTAPAEGTDGPSAPRRSDDGASATALAKEGLAALRARKLEDAESLLHRAIAADRRNATALGGLTSLYFELGQYAKAVEYGEKTVAVAPKSAAHRLRLGDAYYKVLRYDDARAAYLEAKKRGSTAADERLQRLAGKLGTK